MKRTLLFVALLLLVHSPVKADQFTFQERYSSYVGSQGRFTEGLMHQSGFELWHFDNGSQLGDDWEFGWGKPIWKDNGFTLSAAGYYVYWSKSNDHFFLPALFGSYEKGRFQTNFDLMAYVPLTGQSYWFYTDEAWIGYRLNSKWRFGVAGSFFTVNGVLTNAGIGPGLKFDLDKKTTIGFRYLFGIKGADSFRFQVSRTF